LSDIVRPSCLFASYWKGIGEMAGILFLLRLVIPAYEEIRIRTKELCGQVDKVKNQQTAILEKLGTLEDQIERVGVLNSGGISGESPTYSIVRGLRTVDERVAHLK
jgi:hypothetical protein